MIGGNLSEWAINHRTLVVFFMLVCLGAGAMSYTKLGRQEDPPFSIKAMTVTAAWPGATTLDTMQQVTDRIARKLQETPHLHHINSFTKPGFSVLYVNLDDSADARLLPEIWYQVRKKVGDIRHTLPQGIQGPFFNDDFGDVYGILYGVTYDGFTPREARDFAEEARSTFLHASPDVSKIEIFGTQDEKIYLYFSPQKLAGLGISINQVLGAIADQNAVVPAGVITTAEDRILVEVTGALTTEENIASMNLFIDGHFYRLSELAKVQRGYVDPPQKMFRVNGKPAIGIGISMRNGGNNLDFGKSIAKAAETLQKQMPIGIDLVPVANQPDVVKHAISGFTKALFEAVIIVLAVSFLSLGLRAGLVVALSIPLVLAITFVFMEILGIDLQRISLGALIISLGLLVDDAMITVEMMIAKIEEGFEKSRAATFAYTSTAFPMLTGTLVTIAGFMPIGFAKSDVGQYCYSLFAVIGIALTASWFVAVIFAPVIGMTILPDKMEKLHGAGGSPAARVARAILNLLPGKKRSVHGHRPSGHVPAQAPGSDGPEAFGSILQFCMRRRFLTIGLTAGIFAVSIVGMEGVQRQFFPSSDRPELLVTVTLPKNASIAATTQVADRIQKLLDGNPDIDRYSTYIGGGAPRFYLPMDTQLDNDFLTQFVVVGKSFEARDRVHAMLAKTFERDFPEVVARVSRFELGPPVGWPVQYRVSAQTAEEARTVADKVAAIMRASPDVHLTNMNWGEKNKLLRIAVDQDKARQLGLSSKSLAEVMNTVFSGRIATQLRDGIYLIDVLAQAEGNERVSIDTLRNLQVMLDNGRSVPLVQFATIKYDLEEGYMWQRDRLPTITVQADPAPGIEAPTVFKKLKPQIEALQASLPPGVSVIGGGTVEKSGESNASITKQIPLMLLIMATVLMIQLQSFQRLFLVISVAPLGLIGVVAVMLPTRTPMGFVAMLGFIALIGMIIRNSVILVDQIEINRSHGMPAWQAVIEATMHRMRPILLTAAAAILGMIPIMRDVFWGPMAYVVVGGLAGATLLTLLFVPALYVTWFRIRENGARGDRPGKAPQLTGA